MSRFTDFLRFAWFWISLTFMTMLMFVRVFAEHIWVVWRKVPDTTLISHKTAAVWGRLILDLNPSWTYEIQGRQNLPPEGEGAVLVANHSSGLDICGIFVTGIQFRWLSKDTIFRTPLIGQAMKYAGYVPVKRGNTESHKKAMIASAAWIRKGIPMLFFPEGTRSDNGEIRTFKSGAFRLAEQEGVKVYPIVLSGSSTGVKARTLMPKKTHIIVKILPPVQIQKDESSGAFTERVREMMIAEHKQLAQLDKDACSADRLCTSYV